MLTTEWFKYLSFKQRVQIFAALVFMSIIVAAGYFIYPPSRDTRAIDFDVNMSIKDIAPKLGVTGKALAKELKLPLDTPKNKSFEDLGVTREQLKHVVDHLLSHIDATVKYFIYAYLFAGGFIFLTLLGVPQNAPVDRRKIYYPRSIYIIILLLSILFAGFLLGKSPNPMEGIVKVFKSMVGLYPDPLNKVKAFCFFIILAIAGNKIICGWVCPMGSLQELQFSLPILKKIKKRKLPFSVTNSIRTIIFLIMLLFLFGIVGGKRGMVIYHYINPFNLFNLEFETLSILIAVVLVVIFSFFTYRPFCQLICPFGLISWIAERLSVYRVRINRDKCTECGACIKACPLEAAKGRVEGNIAPADCFSCARCLRVCPADAVKYTSVFKKLD
ncbi:4Fe-4S binding protein [Thermodesulfobacteriota bacterium]